MILNEQKIKVSVIHFVFIKIFNIELQKNGGQNNKMNIYLLLRIFFNKSTLTFHFEITFLIDFILVCFLENNWNQRNI